MIYEYGKKMTIDSYIKWFKLGTNCSLIVKKIELPKKLCIEQQWPAWVHCPIFIEKNKFLDEPRKFYTQ